MSLVVAGILAVVLGSGLVAWRFGGPPERFAGAVVMLWIAADAAYHLLFGASGFDTVDPVHVMLDITELAALVWLAVNANRMWPLWAAAAQVICVAGHLAVWLEPHGMRRAYWALTQLPQYVELAALLLGTAAHARRTGRLGPQRSWRRG